RSRRQPNSPAPPLAKPRVPRRNKRRAPRTLLRRSRKSLLWQMNSFDLMPDLPAAAQLGGTPRRFLTFRIGERRYALAAEEVAEVIRIPMVARLPQSPKALIG